MPIQQQTDHKHYGQVYYDELGNPVCHICGRAFPRLMTHVRQVHGYLAREYKLMFGLNLKKGIMSESSREKCRNNVIRNSERVVHNILVNGIATRFKKGAPGRPRGQWSEESLRRLALHNKNMPRRR